MLNKGLKKGEKHIIQDFSKCDFSAIHKYLMERKEAKKNRSKEEKEKEKAEKAALQEKYGWAIVDGIREKIGNFRIEPPGLFLGRGAHPKAPSRSHSLFVIGACFTNCLVSKYSYISDSCQAGKVKARVMPEDVTINIGKEAKVPDVPIPGHKWKEVIHDNTVTWLATWKENINGTHTHTLSFSSIHVGCHCDRCCNCSFIYNRKCIVAVAVDVDVTVTVAIAVDVGRCTSS